MQIVSISDKIKIKILIGIIIFLIGVAYYFSIRTSCSSTTIKFSKPVSAIGTISDYPKPDVWSNK